MSFMAAFFAINITQFPRDEGGTLSLGYVSGIMCKILIWTLEFATLTLSYSSNLSSHHCVAHLHRVQSRKFRNDVGLGEAKG